MQARENLIRASEIGNYLYCQRAWWYQENGTEPADTSEIARGVLSHERHANSLLWSRRLATLGVALLISALVLFTIQFII